MEPIQSFEAITRFDAKILILGSIPGVVSLREKQYYAYPGNQFWRILYALFEIPLETEYEKKILFLKEHKIALWDVIQSCHRIGSLDTNIRSEEINHFDQFFKSFPQIHFVFFNGSKAYDLFRRKIGHTFPTIQSYIQLPSTSPARTIPFEKKLTEWRIIKTVLEL